jgi:zinc transport system ATP-binding protein
MMLLQSDAAVFGYQEAVVGPLSFSVSAGQRLAIMGKNGSGKSTLLKGLFGGCRIFSGRVKLASGAALAYQHQHGVDMPQMPVTGREYLALCDVSDHHLPTGLRALLDQRLDALSGGQRQVLSIWASLASNARLVLLDEPTNNLDPESIALLKEALLNMPGDHAVLLVSHDIDFVASVATDRLFVDREASDGGGPLSSGEKNHA